MFVNTIYNVCVFYVRRLNIVEHGPKNYMTIANVWGADNTYSRTINMKHWIIHISILWRIVFGQPVARSC